MVVKIMQRRTRGTKVEVITDNKDNEETEEMKRQDAQEEVELRRIK